MNSNSDWQNRVGTIRGVALGVMLVAVGIMLVCSALTRSVN
jgi:hypothetical protein